MAEKSRLEGLALLRGLSQASPRAPCPPSHQQSPHSCARGGSRPESTSGAVRSERGPPAAQLPPAKLTVRETGSRG